MVSAYACGISRRQSTPHGCLQDSVNLRRSARAGKPKGLRNNAPRPRGDPLLKSKSRSLKSSKRSARRKSALPSTGPLIIATLIGVGLAIGVPNWNYLRKGHVIPPPPVLAGADLALARLPWQELIYKAPARMEFGSKGEVDVALGGNRTFPELSQLLQSSSSAVGQRVLVSARMRAHLTGNGFQVVANTPEVQIVSTKEPTGWHWQIKANEYGPQTLYLSLNALLTVDGKDSEKSVRTFEHKVVVGVNSVAAAWTLAERHWVVLAGITTFLGSILIFLGKWLVYLFKKPFDRARKDDAYDDTG